MTLAEQYIQDLKSGKQGAGQLVKKAVARHLNLLKDAKRKGYYFDQAAADRVINFFNILRHTSGDYGGKPFELLPWQAFLLSVIFGWKVKATGARLITKVYVEVARKNGKSELAGAIALYLAFFDGEFGAEVYSAANTGDQASICWKAGAAMARMLSNDSPAFAKRCRVYDSTNNRNIQGLDNNSFFKPVASDSKTLDGLRPHGAIIDEYHEAPDASVLQVMESGMVNRRQPLLFVITTAGFNVNGPCFQYRKVIVDILEGRKENDNVFGLIYTLDEKDKWHDEKNWIKCNPSAPNTPTISGLRNAYNIAVTEGQTAEINFRTKNLNQWVTTKSRWISDEVWMKNQAPLNLDPSLRWFAAMDLASVRDITAFVCFSEPDENGMHHVRPLFFIPEEGAKERARRDGVPYLDWGAAGLVELTPGNVTDYDHIYSRIVEVCRELGIELYFYDPWNASQIVITLQTENITGEAFAQTARYFNEPIKYLEKIAASGNLNHDGNAVLRWMCQNVQLYRDGNGNAKIDKGKSAEKVDGIVALAMAVGGYLNYKANESAYTDRGILTI
jgi:phage terminase large subunit-like protein